MRQKGAIPSLVIAGDDYGYRPAYNRGILEAARAGAVDAVSAMVERGFCDPEPLLETGVEVGLHLELPRMLRRSRAGPGERDAAVEALRAQLSGFETTFGRPPAYLDGHHHCHAANGLATAIASVAAERGLAMRSINARHRHLLRSVGVRTPDRLVGRLDPAEPALPELLGSVLEGSKAPPPGVTEWMVHPGYRDPERASSYDAAREQDLELVLNLSDRLGRFFRRLRNSGDRPLDIRDDLR
jgi:chitin disaccharide deacetylase